MNYFGVLIFAGSYAIALFACKKEKIETDQVASLTVSDNVVGGQNLRLGNYLRDSAVIYNYKQFTIVAGNSHVYLYPSDDSSHPYYNNTIQTVNGHVYSLFLSGNSPSSIDATLVEEKFSPYYTDSTIGVRLINLSPNSSSLHVTLASSSGASEFADVAYKQITAFKKYPLPSVIPAGSVSFQIRDTGNTVLTTYTLPTNPYAGFPNISVNLSRNRNITLVVKGLAGTKSGSSALGVYAIADY